MDGDSPRGRLRAGLLSDAHGHAVFVVRDGVVQAANRAATRLFRREAAGLPIAKLVDEGSARKLERIARTEEAATLTEVQVEHEGDVPEAARFSVVVGDGGELVFIGSAAGVAYPEQFGARLLAANEESVRLLRELSRDVQHARVARDALEEISGVREMFIAALAHDIRSPLNAIVLTEAVHRKTAATATPADLERHAAQVERNARSILELIDGVLLAARLDADDPEQGREILRLDELAAHWVESLAPVARQAGVTLDLIRSATPHVRGDRVRLGEVLSNLLSNAIRHSTEGGRVAVEVIAPADRAVCCVADQGPGVPADMRERVFEKFVQAGSTRGSSGLGLYIARRVIELHGGRIRVEENRPRGARFVFELPRVAGDPPVA